MMIARQEDTKLWKENFDKIAEEKKFSTSLSFHSSVSENITKVKTDLRRMQSICVSNKTGLSRLWHRGSDRGCS